MSTTTPTTPGRPSTTRAATRPTGSSWRRGGPRAVVTAVAAVLVVGACTSSEDGTPAPASAAPTSSPTEQPTPASTTTAADACTSDVVAQMPMRRRLAQLLTVGVTGTADAMNVVTAEQVGGIFVGSWTDQAMLTERRVPEIAAASEKPLFVTIDEEGGRVSRLGDLLGEDPSARVAAATMDPGQVYEMALARGRQMADLGITVDFAPDIDVSAQPDDDVIGDRSFSDDPAVVTEYGDAYARGLRDAGIMPVFKHFPGHGSSSGDSHTGAVTVPPLEQLQGHDLVPFRDLVGSAEAVMVGHLEVPGLTDGLPASISPPAIALLRDGVGYQAPPFAGTVFTDDLSGMRAITDQYPIADAVQAALAAGVDQALWISTDDVPAVLDHLEAAVASGELPAARVDDAVRTVLGTKHVPGC